MRDAARRRATILGLALVAALAIAPLAGAHGGADVATQLTIAAREADDCPDGSSYCFVVTEGDLSELGPNTTVRLTFVNEGTMIHNVAVTRLRDADPAHEETPMMGLFAGSDEEVPVNASQTFFFHIPADAGGVYLWCHVLGHEQLGMWLQVSFDGTAAGDGHDAGDNVTHDDGHDATDDTSQNDTEDQIQNDTTGTDGTETDGQADEPTPATPGFEAVAIIAAVAVAAWIRRRR